MSVKPIISSIDSNNNVKKYKTNVVKANNVPAKSVSFQGGTNPVVGLMDFIEAGGFAASFIIQDGLGFIAPRVGKGLVRGGKKKKDENGNDIIGKDGKPERELNWAYARKEGLREIITGPSAFVIPYFMLKGINKKFGSANNVKLNYIDSFNAPFAKFAKANMEQLKAGTANKAEFYREVLKDTIDKSINTVLPEAEKMSAAEIEKIAEEFTQKQLQIEEIMADKSLGKKAKKAKVAELGTVEDAFMKLKKSKIGGAVDELAVSMTSSNGSLKGGSIGELLKSMNDYFADAANTTKKALKDNLSPEQIEKAIKEFTHRRMGSRILTNLGIFGVVAAAYTQIPKLYNMGTGGKNPALANDEEENTTAQTSKSADAASTTGKAENNKDVSFGGLGGMLSKTGEKVFNSKHAKSISDIFELNGPIISGAAMPVLLYGFCIPPRLQHAQDKYDYGEIIVRDMTAFTALLFGAKALARGFSDGFTKLTGLALNKRNMEGRNVFQKIGDYLNPNDSRHKVLTSHQLTSKYTNLQDYKGGVNGFIEFIEQSGGNIKKAFAQDKNVQETVEKILKEFNGKSFKDATVAEVKEALKAANENKTDLIKKFYKLFEGDNGLLRKAKTCNSAFGFFSTIVLVPGLIIWLTDFCEKMTERRQHKEAANNVKPLDNAADDASKKMAVKQLSAGSIPENAPSMAGFLNNR